MQMKKRITWKPVLIVVALIAIVAAVGTIMGITNSRQEQIIAQKQQEIVTAEGLYNTESIVLADTTPA